MDDNLSGKIWSFSKCIQMEIFYLLFVLFSIGILAIGKDCWGGVHIFGKGRIFYI